MKKFGMILIVALFLIGCGAGNTEQSRTTVSDYSILASSTAVEPTKSTSGNTASLIGSWTLVTSSGGYPHAIGSHLTINTGTFSLTQPNASGTYTLQGTTFGFDFGGMVFSFTYSISGNTLSFTGIGNGMNMTYTKS